MATKALSDCEYCYAKKGETHDWACAYVSTPHSVRVIILGLKTENEALKEHIWLSDNQSCVPKWIPVSSGRLPDPHVEVAVLWQNYSKPTEFPDQPERFYKEIGWVNGIGKWNALYKTGEYPVKYWMYLPADPVED